MSRVVKTFVGANEIVKRYLGSILLWDRTSIPITNPNVSVSVFGLSSPTDRDTINAPLSFYTDGTPNVMVGNAFYTYGKSTDSWKVCGARIYIPDSSVITSNEVTFYLYTPGEASVDIALDVPAQTKVLSNLVDGWNEVIFDNFVNVDRVNSSGNAFYICYDFGDGSYLHTTREDSTGEFSFDGTSFGLAETSLSAYNGQVSGVNRVGTGGQSNSASAYYGVDVIMTEVTPESWGYWTFDDIVDSNVPDHSGNDNDLVVSSSGRIVTGYSGEGIRGTANAAEGASSSNEVPTLGTSCSIAGWAKDDATISAERMMFGITGDGGYNSNSQFNLWFERSYFGPTSQICGNYRLSTGLQGLGVGYLATPGEWHHYALTYDGSEVRLYIDGVEVASASETLPIASTGYMGVAVRGDGAVDEVYYFDSVLSPTQVAELASL